MGMDPRHMVKAASTPGPYVSGWIALAVLGAIVGLVLLYGTCRAASATYDEVAYLRVAARYWRAGDQSEITRMGSPLTFWKLQQLPVLWMLDRLGYGTWSDDPIGHQRALLPVVRLGSLWIWLVALALTAAWSRHCHGVRAMALAAWIFALSPNLIAHGALVTMELPLVACTTGMFYLFWRFLESSTPPYFWAAAVLGGLAFSCKYTALIFPVIFAGMWWAARWQSGERRFLVLTGSVGWRMLGFVFVTLLANLVVTGFACVPLSTSRARHPTLERWLGTPASHAVGWLYEAPLPQDWVGCATQLLHQASGGASYLFGQRRMHGWWYYYFVALAVKVPPSFWLLAGARVALGRANPTSCPPLAKGSAPEVFYSKWTRIQGRSATAGTVQGSLLEGTRRPSMALLPLATALFLTITAVGSSRNYGLRYLLPLAPLAIVWVSALAERRGAAISRLAVGCGVGGYLLALASIHPHELTYFNSLAGGPGGGRRILADSNLDWGQGLKSLAALQEKRPELRDITLYYFGDTDPGYYGVAGCCQVVRAVGDHEGLPALESVTSAFVGVSASLEWGPWGPAGFFRALNELKPVCFTSDTTIAIYRTADLREHAPSIDIGAAR
jgi:Dolichyl-phosphate-mannose-protein mannosyltransferase